MRRKKGFIGFTSVCLLFLISCLLFVFVSQTYAFFTDTDRALNELQMSSLDIDIHEEIKDGRKQNVRIQNTSKVKAYIRVLATVPKIQGVVFKFEPGYVPPNWKEGGDGYLYYDDVLEPGKDVTLYNVVTVSPTEGAVLPDDLVNICGDVIFYAEAVQADHILPDDYTPPSGENKAMEAFRRLALQSN